MREQSHLEAMREAIKGDLERARSRNPSIFDRPAPPPIEIRDEPAVDPDPPPSDRPLQGTTAPEPAVETVPQPEPEPAAAAESEPEPAAAAEPEAEPAAETDLEPAVEPEPELEPESVRKSVFRRLLFWR